MKPSPSTSEGARYERASMRSYLRRRIKAEPSVVVCEALEKVLNWLLLRQKRYDKKPGGLGKH